MQGHQCCRQSQLWTFYSANRHCKLLLHHGTIENERQTDISTSAKISAQNVVYIIMYTFETSKEKETYINGVYKMEKYDF